MKKTINHNHNKIRKWFLHDHLHDHLFIKSSDETIEKFISPTNKYKNISNHAYWNNLTNEKLCNSVREIEDNETNYKFLRARDWDLGSWFSIIFL